MQDRAAHGHAGKERKIIYPKCRRCLEFREEKNNYYCRAYGMVVGKHKMGGESIWRNCMRFKAKVIEEAEDGI